MFARLLAIMAAILICMPAVLAQETGGETHHYEGASLAVTLPAGFALEQALEENLPDSAIYLFLDQATGRTLSVELHTYFSSEQRAGWLAGERAASDLAHLDAVERVDEASFPLGAEAAFRFAMAEHGGQGVTLYGCDESRCYRATVVTGPSLALEEQASALFGGIQFGD